MMVPSLERVRELLAYDPSTGQFTWLVGRKHMIGRFDTAEAAYRAECERQMRLLKHELEITKAKGLADTPAYRAAAALVAEDHGGES